MRTRPVIVLLLWLCLVPQAHGVVIGNFDGLDKLIARSAAIAVVRIDEHLDLGQRPNLCTRHRCYVYQSLKGHLAQGEQVVLELRDTRPTAGLVTPFALGSVHLVFLAPLGDGPAKYVTLAWQGANSRLSPLGQERMPEGKTVKEKIQHLLLQAAKYLAEEQRKERAFLERML